MPTPPKDTERLELRIDRKILKKLREEAVRQELPNVQALAVKILTEAVQNLSAPKVKTTAFSDIDLRGLLLDAHRSIAHLTEVISSLEAEKKKTK
jgi:hypothetical protein